MSRRGFHRFGAETAPAGFTPLSLSGLKLWLKAGVGMYQENTFTTPATADGAQVGGWRDQSGSGNDLVQPEGGTNRPLLKLAILNGLPVLRFDGADDYLTNAAFSPTTMTDLSVLMVVTQLSNPGGWVGLLATTAGTTDDYINGMVCGGGDSGSQTSWVWWESQGKKGTDGQNAQVSNLAFGAFKNTFYRYATSETKLYFNGVAEGSRSTNATTFACDHLFLGVRWYLSSLRGHGNWDLAELALYNRDVSAGEQTSLQNYAAAKYGF